MSRRINGIAVENGGDTTRLPKALESVFSTFTFKKYDCRILFMHGTKGNESVSKKAAIKLKAVNPQTEIRCFNGYAHAQLASFEAKKWIDEVQRFLNQ